MKRKQFLQTSLLATGAYFLPNVVLALDKPNRNKSSDLIPERMLVALPNKSDYKFNTDGEVFINTQLSFIDADKQLIPLPDSHYITHLADGYGSPTLYYDGKNNFIFVTTLFKSYKMDGLVYKYNRQDGFEKQSIYQHENMGWYAFWGRCIDDKPTLYHYNYTNSSMMRSQPLETDYWETERIYICPPNEAESLYSSQLKDVNYHTQAHQYGFTYPKITDGFYTFLKFLNQINELEKIEQKNIEAEKEAKNPTVLSSKKVPTTIREIRNRQSLASETGGCGCADKIDFLEPNDKQIRLLKITNTKADTVLYDNKKYYPTTIGYHDRKNKYHKLPDQFYCLADSETSLSPTLNFDGVRYQINVDSLTFKAEQFSLESRLYAHNPTTGFSHAILDNPTEAPIAYIPFTPQYKDPIIYPFLLEEYPYPLTPVYCVGDDLTYAKNKPEILYVEVPGTRIEVPNMPAYKTQDTMGECRAFSMAAIIQKYICDKRKIPDCKNPPPKYDLSYFGMMYYTHAEKGKVNTFNPFGDSFDSMFKILNNYTDNGQLSYLNSCNPFSNMIKIFKTNGIVKADDLKKYNDFVEYLKNLYTLWQSYKDKNSEPADSSKVIAYINDMVGLNLTWTSLKTALMKETFGQYLYSLFFESLDPNKCEQISMPTLSDIIAYPNDKTNATPSDIKAKIIEGLKEVPPKPVLTPLMCTRWIGPNKCHADGGHSMVISGYKKVCEKNNPSECKELFKIHNSWGESWQKENNDGWVDANIYTNSILKDKTGIRISSGAVLWIK
jgi:hypothetical protein